MLKIKGVFITAFILLTQFAWSQSDLAVQGTSPDLYLIHTVQPKETWYSVGRMYNAIPKDIAAFNNVSMDKLNIGQQLKVPLNINNFSQDGNRKPDEVFVPVYHIVQEKEWMYRISQNHNKIPIETLEKWNNVTNDQLQPGMKLIVGYLKVKTANSPLAANGLKKIIPPTGIPGTSVAGTTNTETTSAPVAKNDKPVEAKKEELKKEEPKNAEAKKEISAPPADEDMPKSSKTSAPVGQTGADNSTYSGFKGGYFRTMYASTGKSTAGNAGVFKSTSGWKDGKYYALMNNVPVGTIVKISYNSTNKSIYAKVLGQLPDMRESVGLTIRLSDAAAAELGAEMGKFYVDVSY